MKKVLSLMALGMFIFLSMLSTQSFASDSYKSERLVAEFTRLKAYAEGLSADYTIGGMMKAKEFEFGVTFLWMLSEDGQSDIIRIYRDDEPAFVVSYYKNKLIGQGEMVLRRFVGPDQGGWRNDTILWDTLEYVGAQGQKKPMLKEIDLEVLKAWDIELF